MPKNQEALPALARGDHQMPAETASRRSLRASRARRAAAARAARRRLRGRAGAAVLCGVIALGGGSAVAAGGSGGDAPKASAASSSSLSGSTVRAAQRKLGVEDDGHIGPVTRAAIRDYQRDHDLEVTGRLDRRTLSALGLRARSASAETRGGAAAGETPKDDDSAIPADIRGVLERIAQCESGGDPRAVSADGSYRGKYQFSRETWRSMGGKGDPAKASEREQDRRAAKLYRRAGTSPWPNCA